MSEAVDPKRDVARTESAEPKFIKVSVDILPFTRVVVARTLSELPIEKKFTIENVLIDPKRQMPKQEAPEPKRNAQRMESSDPKLVNDSVDIR